MTNARTERKKIALVAHDNKKEAATTFHQAVELALGLAHGVEPAAASRLGSGSQR
jgi:hypothetical protein